MPKEKMQNVPITREKYIYESIPWFVFTFFASIVWMTAVGNDNTALAATSGFVLGFCATACIIGPIYRMQRDWNKQMFQDYKDTMELLEEIDRKLECGELKETKKGENAKV